MREIWSWSDCNWARTHNYLVRKLTLNHLAKLVKWLSCVVSTYLYGAFDCMFLPCHVRISEWIHTSDFAPALSKEFLDIQATIECEFTLKRARDTTRTYSQMHRTDKYSQHSSTIWPVYKLSGCGFESNCSHLKVCNFIKMRLQHRRSANDCFWIFYSHTPILLAFKIYTLTRNNQSRN